jgi:SPP1 family predicted phage head-tail adaptor
MARVRIDPTIGAGDLDKRVTLLQPVYNEFADEIVDWTPVASVWAGVDPDQGMEVNEAGRTVETVIITMFIRYRRDVDARWRVQDHEHLYEIKGITDIARRRVQLQLSLMEVL